MNHCVVDAARAGDAGGPREGHRGRRRHHPAGAVMSTTTTTYAVAGMTCGHCELSVPGRGRRARRVSSRSAPTTPPAGHRDQRRAPRPGGRRRCRRGGRLLADMNAVPRVLGFVAGCAALFAVALGIGRASVGPGRPSSRPTMRTARRGWLGTTRSTGGARAEHEVGGLESSADGYTLSLARPSPDQGRQRSRVHRRRAGRTRRDGVRRAARARPAPDRRTPRPDRLPARPPAPRRDHRRVDHPGRPPPGRLAGARRLRARRAASQLVLGADLLVPGDFTPEPLGADLLTAHVDGYDVTLGGCRRGRRGDGPHRDGHPGRRAGHRPAALPRRLRAPGLAARRRPRLPARPSPRTTPGPGRRSPSTPSSPLPGRYRLFLDFRHGGAVHTAAFTVTVEGDGRWH